MNLLLIINLLFLSSFHPVGESSTGRLDVQVIKSANRTMLYLDVDNAENVDSLIIHTDIWRVVLGHSTFTDECIFEINSAEETVLKQDAIKSYEIRRDGKSTFYNATDQEYIRKRLLLEQYLRSNK